jgi:hypothetical protein
MPLHYTDKMGELPRPPFGSDVGLLFALAKEVQRLGQIGSLQGLEREKIFF